MKIKLALACAVWDQLSSGGVSWAAYEESVPTACFKKATKLRQDGRVQDRAQPGDAACRCVLRDAQPM
ncbi:MAG TPA: hypothetical protein VKU39_12185 [Streptosporangiaceae bacterium]|nr:hypothetical protein [Streptosporangiaceae bacterium]